MKRKILIAAAAVLTVSAAALAQTYGPGSGMGPGMMGGGYGPGYGMGPGMMGGGYGPGSGMGPGGMGGYGYVPDLTPEQRSKLSEIRQEFAQKHWGLMTAMHSPGGPMEQMSGGDEEAARQAYDAMAEARKQMFEASLQMRKQMDAVLTEEQREQMRGYGHGGRFR